MSRVMSQLEASAKEVADALAKWSDQRERVEELASELNRAQAQALNLQTAFERARDRLFEACPELRPGGPGAYAVGGQRLDVASPSSDPEVIEVDDDTPPDPLGRGGDPDSDEVSFVEH